MKIRIVWSGGGTTELGPYNQSANPGTWNLWLRGEDLGLILYDIYYEPGVNDGTVEDMPANEIDLAEGTQQTVSSQEPTRSGYTFTGWSVNPENLNIVSGSFTMPAADVTFTAQWEAIQVPAPTYSITYAPGTTDTVTGMPAAETGILEGDEKQVYGQAPSRAGYTFEGWTVVPSGVPTTAGTSFLMPDSDVTFTAQWEAVPAQTYSITYVPGTADTVTGMPAAETGILEGDDKQVSSQAPSRAGYTFEGWTAVPSNVPTTAGTSFLMPAANVTFTAQWEAVPAQTYSITYVPGTTDTVTGMPTAETGVSAGIVKTVSDMVPNRAGYTFDGWEAPSGLTVDAEGKFTMPAANVTFTAQWEAVPAPTYSITYVPGTTDTVTGMPAAETGILEGDDKQVSSQAPSRAGYTFEGWTAVPSNVPTTAGTLFKMPEANVTFTAQWEAVPAPTYSITYAPGTTDTVTGMPAAETGILEGDDKQVSSQAPSRAGYTFEGWAAVPSNVPTTAGTLFKMPAVNVTFTAQWELIELPPPPVTVYYSITVRYLNEANGHGVRGTYTSSAQAGSSYNLTAQTTVAITGYTLTRVEGDSVAGTVTDDVQIDVYYRANQNPVDPEPTYYTIIVNYLDEETGLSLHDAYTRSIREGRNYDLSEQTALAITDYSLTRVEGAVTGTATGNIVIDVYYCADEVIGDEPNPGGGAEDPGDDIVLDEDIPGGPAELPNTGGAHPAILYSLGLAMTVVGFKLRKK